MSNPPKNIINQFGEITIVKLTFYYTIFGECVNNILTNICFFLTKYMFFPHQISPNSSKIKASRPLKRIKRYKKYIKRVSNIVWNIFCIKLFSGKIYRLGGSCQILFHYNGKFFHQIPWLSEKLSLNTLDRRPTAPWVPVARSCLPLDLRKACRKR